MEMKDERNDVKYAWKTNKTHHPAYHYKQAIFVLVVPISRHRKHHDLKAALLGEKTPSRPTILIRRSGTKEEPIVSMLVDFE
jgi:hypothetical protein